MSLSPRVIALLGFGEAGSAIARGLAADGGWRGASRPGDNAPRRLIAIDTALDQDARGTALGKQARALDVAIEGRYSEALSQADLVICAVQGEHALEAAEAAAPFLKKGAHYLDLCTVTGKMSDEDRAPIEAAGGRYVDIAVMGGFFKQGIKAPMLVAGEDIEAVVAWMNANGFDAKVLGPKPGSASSVKMLRSVLIKGVEALGVESLVTAQRQGILEREDPRQARCHVLADTVPDQRSRPNPPPHPHLRQRVLDHEQRRLRHGRLGKPRGTLRRRRSRQNVPQVVAQVRPERRATAIDLRAEQRLGLIQLARHPRILRALPAEHEHGRPLARLRHARHDLRLTRMSQRVRGTRGVAAHEDSPMREHPAADLKRVRDVGQRRVAAHPEVLGQLRGRRLESGAGLRGEQQQLPGTGCL